MHYGVAIQPERDLKRAANDILYASAAEDDPALPYFCECDDAECLKPVWLERDAYEEIRRSGRPLTAAHPRRQAAAR